MNPAPGGAEASIEGFGLKAKLANITSLPPVNTGLTFAALAGVVALLVGGYFHEAAAQKREEIATTKVAESNEKMAKVLQENNAAARESTAAIVSAIKSLAVETKLVGCLNDPAMRNRADAYEACKRLMSRADR